MKTVFAAAAVAALALAAGAASAQPRQGFQPGGPPAGPSITLYELPNFQGQSRTYTSGIDNLADVGFNDRAQSVRVQGRWRLCEAAGLRGRCAELTTDVPNLATLALTGAVSSFESLERYAQNGPDSRGPDSRGPGVRGPDIPGSGPYNGVPGPGGYGNGYDRGPVGQPPGFGDRIPGGDDRFDRDRGGFNRNDRSFAGPMMDGRGVSFFPRPLPGPYRDAAGFCRRLGFSAVVYSDQGRDFQIRDVLCRR